MARDIATPELCELLDVHRQTVQQWLNNGCPVVKRAKRGDKVGHLFNLKAVMEWREARAVTDAIGADHSLVSMDEARRRKAIADAALAELELAKAKGIVAPLDQFERALMHTFAEIKVNIRNIPHRVVTQLIGETDEIRFKEVMTAEVDQALEALSNFNLLGDYDDADE